MRQSARWHTQSTSGEQHRPDGEQVFALESLPNSGPFRNFSVTDWNPEGNPSCWHRSERLLDDSGSKMHGQGRLEADEYALFACILRKKKEAHHSR